MHKARLDIQEMEQQCPAFLYTKHASEWIWLGDRVTKDFFNVVQPRFKRAWIQALKNIDSTLVTDINGIRQVATSYYEKLLTAEAPSEETLVARQEIWRHVEKG